MHACTKNSQSRADDEAINAVAIDAAAPMDTTMEEDDDMRIP
jgi:hypothetical protein